MAEIESLWYSLHPTWKGSIWANSGTHSITNTRFYVFLLGTISQSEDLAAEYAGLNTDKEGGTRPLPE